MARRPEEVKGGRSSWVCNFREAGGGSYGGDPRLWMTEQGREAR